MIQYALGTLSIKVSIPYAVVGSSFLSLRIPMDRRFYAPANDGFVVVFSWGVALFCFVFYYSPFSFCLLQKKLKLKESQSLQEYFLRQDFLNHDDIFGFT